MNWKSPKLPYEVKGETTTFNLSISTGHSDDPAYTKEQARLAKEEGIHIYVVGVGLEKTQELHDIASPPAIDNIFTSKTFKDLDNLEAKLFSVFSDNCPRKTLVIYY